MMFVSYILQPKNVAPLRQCTKIKIILLGDTGSGKTRFFQYAIGEPIKSPVSTVSF